MAAVVIWIFFLIIAFVAVSKNTKRGKRKQNGGRQRNRDRARQNTSARYPSLAGSAYAGSASAQAASVTGSASYATPASSDSRTKPGASSGKSSRQKKYEAIFGEKKAESRQKKHEDIFGEKKAEGRQMSMEDVYDKNKIVAAAKANARDVELDNDQDADREKLMEKVYDLMVKGPDDTLSFQRDFLAEGTDMLNSFQNGSE